MDKSILGNIDPYQLGQELERARTKKGLTQEEAAKIIDVARTTVTAIEGGKRRIKPAELIKLAHAYGRQVSDFVRPRPIIEPFQVQFRGPADTLLKESPEATQIVDDLEELCRDYLELEQITNSPLPKKYPEEYRIQKNKPEQSAEIVALEERSRLNLGDNPVTDLRAILEQVVGLRIFYFKMPSKFSALYFFTEELGGCIAVNSLHGERQRWSLAHEYGHFLVHRHQAIIESETKRKPENERFADRFAEFFLLPTSSIKRRFNTVLQAKKDFAISDLALLAHYYKVSFEAITRRLEDLELIPTGSWDKLKLSNIKVSEIYRALSLNDNSSTESQLPMRYQFLALEALEKGLISEGQFARFMRLEREDALHFTPPDFSIFSKIKTLPESE